MPRRNDIHKILIIGSGPIIIGQACEFDYSGTQACKALKSEGYQVVLVNSNPATIMTDPELADCTYIEPLAPEYVEAIIERERPDALLSTVGGQTALNLSVALAEAGVLERYGVDLIGAGLRAIVRQDPNVILVGEIRDTETAEISIHAALTGHMVMSTLHTRNAVGAISRLVNMKVEPYLLAAALTGVIAQRLLRLLCERCKKPKMPDPRDVDRLGVPLKHPGPFYASVGCDHCMGTGYAGRVGIYEWLLIEREMRSLIVTGATEDQLSEAARAAGVKSLQESGLERVYQGTTSLEEVVRVTREG